jgi:hypothetical protein
LIARLQEELIDLKNRLEVTKTGNEKRMRELTQILGIETIDTDLLLQTQTTSSKDLSILSSQREAVQKAEHLRHRN